MVTLLPKEPLTTMQLDQSNGTLECRGKSKRLSTPSRSQTGDLLLCKCFVYKADVSELTSRCRLWMVVSESFHLGCSSIKNCKVPKRDQRHHFNYRNRISRSLTVPVGLSCPRRPTWRCRGARPSAGVSAAGSRSCRPATPCAKFHSLQRKEIPGISCQHHFVFIDTGAGPLRFKALISALLCF